MKEVPISQMHTLEEFDIVALIDDETKEIQGYYLNNTYKIDIEAIIDKEKNNLDLMDET